MGRAARRSEDRRALVDRVITEFALFIKKRCPAAELEISLTRFEDEDGHILVFPPDRLAEADRDRLDAEIAKRSVDILLKTGVLILAGVYESSQRPRGQRSTRPRAVERAPLTRKRR
jgi:hypothetical protein